jgi:regulator of replication initiation timing
MRPSITIERALSVAANVGILANDILELAKENEALRLQVARLRFEVAMLQDFHDEIAAATGGRKV